jgi:hypothetical protein
MGLRLNVVAVLLSLSLFACGSRNRGDAAAPEGDPWAGYKGTYATASAGDAPSSSTPSRSSKKAPKTEAAQSEALTAAPVVAPDPTPAPAPAATPTKKAKASAKPVAKKNKK